jgi:hypothetical protein
MRQFRRMQQEPLQLPAAIEAELGLPPGYLRQRRASPGGPPFYKLSRKTVAYRRSDVARWLEACASTSSAGQPCTPDAA